MLPLILFFVILLAYWWWKQYRLNLTEPPSFPGAWPIIGHIHLILGDDLYLWRTVNEMVDTSFMMGGVGSAFIGPRTVYVVTDPDECFTVANACLEKDTFYDFAKPWLGEGLVTGKLSIWRNHRKLLNPAFSQIVLDGFIEVLNRQSRRLVKDLQVEVGHGPFEHWKYTRHNALETICLTALGVDFSDHTILNSEYVEAAEEIFKALVERFQKFWLHSSLIFQYSDLKKKQDGWLKTVHNMSDTVLKRRKSEMNGNILKEEKSPDKKFKAFMDLLLELSMERGVLNDKEIRDHIDTMIVGGHDTSANVMMYAMILLGSHPDVQDKAYAEVLDVIGDSDRDIEKQDLSQLVYLEAVLKESMRVYTIVPIIARKLDKNVKLKRCTLKAGRTCFMFLFGIHRHPVWGPDADQFKPERWLDPSTLPDTPNAFTGFGVGRRMCIGKAYALMSMKITLAHLLRNYRIKADHTKLILKFDVMLKPVSGHHITVERR
ncbi:cytochrome P450 4C1-like [Manduca sexta]|uniref:cytochrome P450 4C1-like n=1 Tax=Manduca sexta TaxID=7130 RepID=UPI00188DCC88|nr:cytochrome P450 4C1-like [Manduca sexta]